MEIVALDAGVAAALDRLTAITDEVAEIAGLVRRALAPVVKPADGAVAVDLEQGEHAHAWLPDDYRSQMRRAVLHVISTLNAQTSLQRSEVQRRVMGSFQIDPSVTFQAIRHLVDIGALGESGPEGRHRVNLRVTAEAARKLV